MFIPFPSCRNTLFARHCKSTIRSYLRRTHEVFDVVPNPDLPAHNPKQTIFFYKIECKQKEVKDYYVGYTSTGLSFLLSFYATNILRNKKSIKIFETIRNTGGISNWKLQILEYSEVTHLSMIHTRKLYWKSKFDGKLIVPSDVLMQLEEVPESDYIQTKNRLFRRLYRERNQLKIRVNLTNRPKNTVRTQQKLTENRVRYRKMLQAVTVYCECGFAYKGMDHKLKHEATRKHQLLLQMKQTMRDRETTLF